MAGLAPLLLLRLSLSTCCVLLLLLAACPSLAIGPCEKSVPKGWFKTFKERHLPPGTPDTRQPDNEWHNFIKDNTPLCNRPKQSFLPPDTLALVEAVCSSQGGKVYEDNLCISKEKFKLVVVMSKLDTCEITSVKEETKHLILECNKVDNGKCLPVHFDPNKNKEPANNALDCTAP